jgi:Protein of Unknown function (DUF2784)
MLWSRILADLIVVFHLAYVSFIVFGLAAILLGIVFRWGWVRNIWFRSIHLIAIAIVVAEALAGVPCPLTVWEKQLRVMAGQATYAGDFLGYWAHQLIFYRADPWVFTALYVAFGAGVLAAFVLAPPRRGARYRGGMSSDSTGAALPSS